jgi:hypothetical protein
MGVWCTFRGREMLGMFQLGLTSEARVEHRNSTKKELMKKFLEMKSCASQICPYFHDMNVYKLAK